MGHKTLVLLTRCLVKPGPILAQSETGRFLRSCRTRQNTTVFFSKLHKDSNAGLTAGYTTEWLVCPHLAHQVFSLGMSMP